MVVVLASAGYPGAYPKGEKIEIPQNLPPSSSLIHAGTDLSDDGSIISSGGRVLGAVGTGPTLEEAKESAYRLCESVDFPSKFYRKDIGHREFSRSN